MVCYLKHQVICSIRGNPYLNDILIKAHLRLNDIGFIFQASHLVPYLKVLDQLTLIGKETGMSSKEAQARAKNY